MVKISHASCPGLSLVISAQFIIGMCAAAENYQKTTKPPTLRVKVHSMSSMLTTKKLVTTH